MVVFVLENINFLGEIEVQVCVIGNDFEVFNNVVVNVVCVLVMGDEEGCDEVC